MTDGPGGSRVFGGAAGDGAAPTGIDLPGAPGGPRAYEGTSSLGAALFLRTYREVTLCVTLCAEPRWSLELADSTGQSLKFLNADSS